MNHAEHYAKHLPLKLTTKQLVPKCTRVHFLIFIFELHKPVGWILFGHNIFDEQQGHWFSSYFNDILY